MRKDTGTLHVQDVYQGPGLAGVPRRTIKQLRVVGLGWPVVLKESVLADLRWIGKKAGRTLLEEAEKSDCPLSRRPKRAT